MFEVDSRNITHVDNILPIIGMSKGCWGFLCVFNVLIVVLGTVGNLIVLYSSLVHQAIKFDKVTLFFVHNLATADLVMIFLIYTPMLSTILTKKWVLGKGVCWLVGYFFGVPIVYEVLSVFIMSGNFQLCQLSVVFICFLTNI